MIFNMGGFKTVKSQMPEFTYTGTYTLINDGKDGAEQNWRIKFLTSGVLTFSKVVDAVDIFLVGGGGGTRPYSGGAGGGRTLTQKAIKIEAGVPYQITVGAGGVAIAEGYAGKPGGTGGTTKAFGYSAEGGFGGVQNGSGDDGVGGDGGSGGGGYSAGRGGVDGADGTNGSLTSQDENGIRTIAGGKGLDETTREFWEPDGQLYASGGDGCYAETWVQQDAPDNTGNGAPGNVCNGGSGIVVIRNAR